FVEKARERRGHRRGARETWRRFAAHLRPSANEHGKKKPPADGIDGRRQIDAVGRGIEEKLLVLVFSQRANLRQQRSTLQNARKALAKHARGTARGEKNRGRCERQRIGFALESLDQS